MSIEYPKEYGQIDLTSGSVSTPLPRWRGSIAVLTDSFAVGREPSDISYSYSIWTGCASSGTEIFVAQTD